MRCLACEFENPEHQPNCYRCEHPLDLSEIDVEPPRQSRGSKEMWRWFPSERELRWNRVLQFSRASKVFLWFISYFPGLGHLVLGQRRWAGGLAVAWLVTSLWVDGTLSFHPRGMVMMVQCVAMTEAYRQSCGHRPGTAEMLGLSLFTSATLAVVNFMQRGGVVNWGEIW